GGVLSGAGSRFGADDENATTAFSLDVASAGVLSGIRTTDDDPIALFKEGDLVVGRYDSDNSGTIDGDDDAAFAISIDASTCVLSRSEEHTSELQSRENLVCRLLLEK